MSAVKFEACDTKGVWIGEADSEGPTVAILGGVHGDESTGIEVVERSLEKLDFDTGTVILMLGNLAALGESRYTENGVNLNRQFRKLTKSEEETDPLDRPYEVNRAQELIPYLDVSAAALDLHDFTDPCPPFIICERNAVDTARYIGAPIISFGWSKTEPGGTDGYMFEQGKEGLCYELGQKTKPAENLNRGHGAVERFLLVQGLKDGDLSPLYAPEETRFIQTDGAYVRTSSDSFEFARDFTNFQALTIGELIATDGNTELRANPGACIIFPMPQVKVGEEAFTQAHDVSL